MAINVMFYGLGPIGSAVARQVATRKGFKIAGGIDIDPAKLGQDLGDVIGLGHKLKIRVTNDAAGALKREKPDVVVLCTSSSTFSPIASSPLAFDSEPSAPTCSASRESSSSGRLENKTMGMSCVPYSFFSVRQISVPLASGM